MSSAKIMIVEDNATVAEDCRDCMEHIGYEVASITASGEEAVEQAGSSRPDAVLMDICLRGKMDGIEAADRIYNKFGIPVVFLSAYSDHNLLERAKKVGSFGYLIKPFDEREIYTMLEMALYKVRAEKERKKMEARLHQAQKMEAVGVLAGGIAHQFNNALSVIIGYIDLVEMEYSNDSALLNYMEGMRASADRMTQLTSQLLAYARGGKYRVETVSLCGFVRKIIPEIQELMGSGILINTGLQDNDMHVRIDSTQIHMVLSAVISNAAEAMDGKGCVRLDCFKFVMRPDETINDAPWLKPGDYAVLEIIDKGRGMDEATKNRIFEPFFTTGFKGRGLGMAAVYGIVKNHDGWVSVASEPGNGTTVKIYLPIVEN